MHYRSNVYMYSLIKELGIIVFIFIESLFTCFQLNLYENAGLGVLPHKTTRPAFLDTKDVP